MRGEKLGFPMHELIRIRNIAFRVLLAGAGKSVYPVLQDVVAQLMCNAEPNPWPTTVSVMLDNAPSGENPGIPTARLVPTVARNEPEAMSLDHNIHRNWWLTNTTLLEGPFGLRATELAADHQFPHRLVTVPPGVSFFKTVCETATQIGEPRQVARQPLQKAEILFGALARLRSALYQRAAELVRQFTHILGLKFIIKVSRKFIQIEPVKGLPHSVKINGAERLTNVAANLLKPSGLARAEPTKGVLRRTWNRAGPNRGCHSCRPGETLSLRLRTGPS